MDHPVLNPAAPHHLPSFVTAPGQSDWLMTMMAVFLFVAVISVGLVYLKLHALPEHMAHRTNKVQLQFVAVLGLLPQGSSCVATACTSNHDALQDPAIGGFHAFVLHAIDAGLVHAALLRLQALILPVRTLVLSGH
ncbi:MAG: hypothetical protein QM699_13015 [Amaricoccus sp.]|uniref:hypothetical protein n=1 Tax=Amaricoccus sp. TaxID=1872485 RepID=UPI0039E6A202